MVVGAIRGTQLEALRAASDKLVAEICAQGGHGVAEPRGGGNRGWGRYSFGVASDSGSCFHQPEWAALVDVPPVTAVLTALWGSADYRCTGGGGDFVLPHVHDYQPLHSGEHSALAGDVCRVF